MTELPFDRVGYPGGKLKLSIYMPDELYDVVRRHDALAIDLAELFCR